MAVLRFSFGEMDHHEAAAAEIAGHRIGHGKREADRHRGIDRVAAALEDIDADPRGAAFLRHHHAMTAERALRRRDRRLRAWAATLKRSAREITE